MQHEAQLLKEFKELQAVDAVPSEAIRAERLSLCAQALRKCREEMKPYSPDFVRVRSGQPLNCAHAIRTLQHRITDEEAVVSLYCGSRNTYAFILKRVAKPTWMRLGIDRDQCEQAGKLLRRAFNGAPDEFPPYPSIRRERPFDRSLSFLRALEAAFAPLFDSLDGMQLVHIAPHGPLHTIPLHALRMRDDRYVAEHMAINYWPSISTVLGARPTTPPRSGRTRVFVGGIASRDDAQPDHFMKDAELFRNLPCDITSAMS